ncbi:MAG: hypothetical protein NZ898_11270 [Myxococcota bacterium]|nr:hypothetical protein [Myxococcota bacterium]MDW8363339.1 hypothetical protein [Myxococcales bacterium]
MVRSCAIGLVLCLGASACGASSTPTATARSGARAAAPTSPETQQSEGEPGSDPEPATAWLGELRDGETLTYLVHEESGREHRVRMRVARVVRRGESIGIHLAPVGALFSEDAPIYPRWVIADARGLAELEPHVEFTVPGWEPLDAEGRLRTEAADNLAWRVPVEWLRPGSASRPGDAVLGWTLVGYEPRVEGAVRAERCARIERADGGERVALLVCADLGVVEKRTVGEDGVAQRWWRLVDAGASREELDPEP